MTCPHCAAGHMLLVGKHVQVTERGVANLGPCTATPEERQAAEHDVTAFRLWLQGWRERVMAAPTREIIHAVRAAHWSEEDDDGRD